jgi:hypothetical protein
MYPWEMCQQQHSLDQRNYQLLGKLQQLQAENESFSLKTKQLNEIVEILKKGLIFYTNKDNFLESNKKLFEYDNKVKNMGQLINPFGYVAEFTLKKAKEHTQSGYNRT